MVSNHVTRNNHSKRNGTTQPMLPTPSGSARCGRRQDAVPNASMRRGGLSAAMLQRLVRLLEQRGVDPNMLFADLRLSPAVPADARIPYSVVDAAIERTAGRLGPAGLGLALARVRDDAAYGAAGLLLLASENLRQGLSLAFAYQRIWGDGERFTLEARTADVAIRFRHPGRSRLASAVLAECALAETLECARELVDSNACPLCVQFEHTSFGENEALVHYFGIMPSFGGTTNTIVFATELMDRPLTSRRTILRPVFEQQCRQALSQLAAATTVAQRVRDVLPALLGETDRHHARCRPDAHESPHAAAEASCRGHKFSCARRQRASHPRRLACRRGSTEEGGCAAPWILRPERIPSSPPPLDSLAAFVSLALSRRRSSTRPVCRRIHSTAALIPITAHGARELFVGPVTRHPQPPVDGKATSVASTTLLDATLSEPLANPWASRSARRECAVR